MLTAAPIHKFSQSISVPLSTLGVPSGKPAVSDIEVTHDQSTAFVLANAATSKVLTPVTIVIGSLTIKLSNVSVTAVKAAPAQAGHAQEVIGLSFATIDDGSLSE